MVNEQIVNNLIKEYAEESNVVVGEFLADKKVPKNMSFEEAFKTYIAVMKLVNGDSFYIKQENELKIL